MGFLDKAIKKGLSDAVSKAVTGAVKNTVTPAAEKLANKTASKLTDAVDSIGDTFSKEDTQQTAAAPQSAAPQQAENQEAQGGLANLAGVFANLERAAQGYATEMSKNLKICPSCGAGAAAEQKFCPECGTRLPEQTLAQGAVCPSCGKQNDIGTKFCADCGTKLPSAIAAEQAKEESKAAVLAQWDTLLPQYPKWSCGGTEYYLEACDGYIFFRPTFANYTEASNAIAQYRNVLMQSGFAPRTDAEHLYKTVGGICYHVDTEHCFEGDNNRPDIYFTQQIPKPVETAKPTAKKGLFDIFR